MADRTWWKAAGGVLLLCALVLGAVLAWRHYHRVDTPPPPPPRTIGLAELVQSLADQASSSVGDADTYRIVPIKQGSYPVGTLVSEKQPSIPINFDACRPAERPFLTAPNLFPHGYHVDSRTAVDIGLTPDVKRQVSAKVALGDTQGVDLGFEALEISTLAADDIDAALADPACRKAVQGRAVMLVRGIIRGKRRFTLQRAVSSGGEVNTLAGSFRVSAGSGKSDLLVTDAAPQPFLEILSVLSAPVTPAAPGRVPPAIEISAPAAGRLYLQRDVADDPARAEALRATLRQARYDVVQGIEAVPSRKMPATAQVRYFNASDKAKAEAVRALVAAAYPGATISQMPLASPPGQLEIWLARKP